MLRKKTWAIVFGALLLVTSLAFARGDGQLIRVTTGSQTIADQNIPQARKLAVAKALEIALQNAVASLVPPQVFAANLEFLYARILPRTREYLVNYRVLGGVEQAGEYRVGVEATINMGLLESTLNQAKILNVAANKPSLLFLIAEQNPRDILPRFWWGHNPEPYTSQAEELIIQRMVENHFKIIGGDALRPDPSEYNIQFGSIYDVKSALALARELSADMVVMGKAQVAEAINRMGDQKTFDAVIRLDVYEMSTGQKVAVSNTHATSKSGEAQEGFVSAMDRAADLAAADLGAQLDQVWTQNLKKESQFDVSIQGTNFLPRFIQLKKRFREMLDIQNISHKEVGSDQAVLDVVYNGSPTLFADTLMLKTFEGFGLDIEIVSKGLVAIRFIEKEDRFLGN